MKRPTSLLPALTLLITVTIHAAGADSYFTEEVWPKVGAHSCLKCHKNGGDAEDSNFVLQDPARDQTPGRHVSQIHNHAAFTRMAKSLKDDQSRLLLKATGKLDHEGEEVLKPDSTGYRILSDFVRRLDSPQSPPAAAAKNAPPFFDGVSMLDDQRLLRRVALSLAGRLPSDAELKSLGKPNALSKVLDALMKEDAFYDRLREGFNDIFLTVGADGNAETFLSYDHFQNTRLWYQKHDLSHIKDEKERRLAGYKLANQYREAIHGEPMRLIEHIVRNDKPFTEIVTADYIMVTPYSARGYGVFVEIKAQFKNVDDPFEYVPVKLKALKGRSKQQDQESATGFYPHAGLLSTFQYLCRYPTTETNRNRLRARMYYQHFLGVDVLELAARVSDAAAATAKYKVPTMEAAECVVCHKTLDPVAGLFQDYWRFAEQGVYGKRKEGWFTDMFGPGYEGEDLAPAERWRSLQWLGERTAKDPRFAVAMVEHVYYILTGRKVLLSPKDLDDPLFTARHRAQQEQRALIETVAAKFAKSGFNLKHVFKDWVTSDFYRADGLTTVAINPEREAELDDLGIVRMLAPEQVERKLAAIFGKGWGRLHSNDGGLGMLYGGIDSKEVTERALDPSGAMGAIQRLLSNDVACKATALDFSRPAAERVLFPHIEPDVQPGTTEKNAQLRKAIEHLHQRILGRVEAAEVERTFQLFSDILADAHERKGVEKQESYYCRPAPDQKPSPDPHYTVRAWRGVVTYLLRQHDFLYE
ncbi:MAG: hypothetical protein ACKVY0_07850 [Prosthecobacter sp.]|uniref:hypothetical protein n=1 Tax=Prosthecobacter sp. TaxID=1965333 RepID=UPI003903BBE5